MGRARTIGRQSQQRRRVRHPANNNSPVLREESHMSYRVSTNKVISAAASSRHEVREPAYQR
jgi:hypothetical protein